MSETISDRIDILLPELPCRIGVLPGENDRIQPIRVELGVDLDLEAAARTGELDSSLDYATLHGRATERILSERWTLLEVLAGSLLDLCLDDDRVRSARVMVEKCAPPFPTAVGPVRVHMRRHRREAT